jgi:hypothetical protein
MTTLDKAEIALSTDFGNANRFCRRRDAPLPWFLIEHKTIERFKSVQLPTPEPIKDGR